MKRFIILSLAVFGLVALGLTRPVMHLTWSLLRLLGQTAFWFGRWSKF